jgi:hypothetical protein
MSFTKNSKTLSAVAALGATAMLLIGSLNSASAAESKSSDSKETKSVCVEGQRNIGTVQAPVCISNGASAYEIAVKLGSYSPGTPAGWIASLKGAKGDQGLVGPVGPQGVSGDVGPRGPQGETGFTGSDGAKGDQGDQGATGEKGDKGDKGDTGAAGTNGTNGADANVIGTACSFDTTKESRITHHTGVWGFAKINNGFAAYGCILAGNDQGDD